jgi:hypothetical protein
MNINIGTTEQKIRIGLGVLLLIVGAVTSGALSIVALVVGVVAMVTGAVRFCPAWTLLGINTSDTGTSGKSG